MSHTVLNLPEEDRALSPHTGYTRQHWEACADGLLTAAWRWASPRGARLDLPGKTSRSGVVSDGLEGYARTFLAAAFRVAGANGEDPHGWLPRYAEGLIAGTSTPGHDDAESWPVIRDFFIQGQPMVESASVALGLRLTRPWLWDKLSSAEQDRADAWLRDALVSLPAANNWYLFPYTVAGFLDSVGRGDELTTRIRQRGLELLDSWDVGQGWYTDGDGGAYDYYNGWALHLYPVLDELMAAREAGEDPSSGTSIYRQRLSTHLESLSHFFAADGAPVYFGRSMTYRFAAAAAVGLGAATSDTPLTPGASRRIISGTLKYFLDRGALNSHGLLSLGWHGEHAPTVQHYSGPASPYWASKGFVCLLAGADHPLWTATEEPAPAETGDHVLAVEPAGLLLHSTAQDGVVRLHNHGSDHLRAENGAAAGRPDPLYTRWAYSSHTGPTTTTNTADNDLAVIWQNRRGSRTQIHPLGAGTLQTGSGWAASWHRPVFDGPPTVIPGLKVLSVVVVHGTWEVRVHAVTAAPAEAALETTGWATPDPRTASDDTQLGPASVLVPLHGWSAADDVIAPAGTAYTAAARVPRLRAEVPVNGVYVCLAALSGEEAHRPDPSTAVEDLTVTDDAVTFRWAGESAPVRIGFTGADLTQPVTVTLGGTSLDSASGSHASQGGRR
ncbi:DUF2264 domain-containing protein [Nesterenkonia alba]|uniref:DUF2264 domain-containing protein n=1 Tax=Nesterenkonia alba TaxID=515814 RepID=UPI0003B4EF9F|nr:DUF2264 domain-containing protein [Nesterenkonia alba]